MSSCLSVQLLGYWNTPRQSAIVLNPPLLSLMSYFALPSCCWLPQWCPLVLSWYGNSVENRKSPVSKSWDTFLPSPPPSQKVLELFEKKQRLPGRAICTSMVNRLNTWLSTCSHAEVNSKLLPAENSDFACRCLPPRWVKMAFYQSKTPD